MQRHWEGGMLRDEMEETRYKELSYIAMLARRDIDRYLWLSEFRPDLAQFAPGPPGLQMVAESKIRKKKKSVGGYKPVRKGYYSNRCIDNLVRSGGRELSDLLRFFSKLDVDLQKLLLDAIATHSTKKMEDLVQEDVVQRDGREPTLAWLKLDEEVNHSKDHQPRQLGRSCTVPKVHPIEEKVHCIFREWKQVSKQQNSCEDEKFNTERENSRGESTPNSSCRLTNSSGRVKGGCGRTDSQDGVCRDAAIQTGRSLRKSPKLSHKARDHTWDVAKSHADHASQISTRQEHIATKTLREDIENLREQATVNVLQRWAEPLEQYLSTLQKFEQELREKWLTPEELETVPNPETQRGGLESVCVQHASDFMRAPKTQMQMPRMPLHEVEAQPDETIVNRKFGGGLGDDLTSLPQLTRYGGSEHLLDNSKQEKFATREHEVKTGCKKPELWPPDKHFRRTRSEMSESSAMANSLASRPKNPRRDSETRRGKSKQEYLDAGFRTRKLVERWPSDKPVKTSKSRSPLGNLSSRRQLAVYDPKTLLVLGPKAKREQIPADNLGVKARKKPEWWPALRRPYSASEVKLNRQKEEVDKAIRKSPSKIVTGYLKCPHSQSSYKSQRSRTEETEITRNQCTSASMSQHDSVRRTLQKRTAAAPPTVAPLPRSHQKPKDHQQEVDVSQEAHKHCLTMDRPHHMSFLAELERLKQLYARKSPQKADEKCQKMERPCNVGAVGELEQLNVRKPFKSRIGQGGLYALQTPRCSNSSEPSDQHGQSGRLKVKMQCITSITNTGEDQVCEFITQGQPEHDQELQVTSSLLRQIKTRREADVQADVKSQKTVRREFRVAPVVAPAVDLHNREHEVEMAKKERQKTNCIVQQGVERLADKLIDQAVKEVASELAEFVETVAEQMYMAEFMP